MLAGVAFVTRATRKIQGRSMLNYDPAQDCVLGAASKIEVFPLTIDAMGIEIPDLGAEPVSAWLELEVEATLLGKFNDPALSIGRGSLRDTQAVEQGISGRRYFNISRLLRLGENDRIALSPKHLKLLSQFARLHVSRFALSDRDRVLVIAPHPDDAEIGSFGLYADSDSAVVTITAGQRSDHYRKPGTEDSFIPEDVIAKLRVIDSISVPWLGGVDPSKSINLCFPDGQLGEMVQDPERDFAHALGGTKNFESLRRLNRFEFLQESTNCSWRGLIGDLARIIEATKPTIVVAPHPLLDRHTDHFYSVVAVDEALQSVTSEVRAVLFTCIHNERSELWPFGEAGDGYIALPIFTGEEQAGESVYSHTVSPNRLKLKFLALEAMHDLRETDWSLTDSADRVGERLMAEARKQIHGTGGSPTSYFRRAMRPDEVFFVSSPDFAHRLIERALSEVREAPAATSVS